MSRLPVTVRSGFLGTDRPTLLDHVRRTREGRRVAVFVNDVSEIDVDAQLVRDGGAALSRVDEQLVELALGATAWSALSDPFPAWEIAAIDEAEVEAVADACSTR